MRVQFRASILALASLLSLSACNPSQIQQALAAKGHTITTDQAAAISAHLTRPSGPRSLTDAQLARLAKCESGGNPTIVSKSGSYHGLYQFDQRTWNGVAKRVAPEWSGVRPSAAPAEVQHAMARTLYADRGRSPWPVCGRRI